MNQARSNAVTARLPRTDAASALVRIERLERLLEGAIPIPGLSRRIGLDDIIGLVPWVGRGHAKTPLPGGER